MKRSSPIDKPTKSAKIRRLESEKKEREQLAKELEYWKNEVECALKRLQYWTGDCDHHKKRYSAIQTRFSAHPSEYNILAVDIWNNIRLSKKMLQ